MTLHKKDYQADCETPRLTYRWKEGQVWICPCGNMFKVGIDCYGDCWKVWKHIPDAPKGKATK